MNNKTVLLVEGIEKSFPGTKALDNMFLEVKEGEVHALVGENGAGKSTLMNIISGVISPDQGKIIFMGKEIKYKSPREAQELGIGFVHQELSLCPQLTVAENMFMGREPKNSFGIIDKRELCRKTQKLLDLFYVDFTPQDQVSDLNVAEQQIIEIGKALSLNCKLIILDEPTSSITEKETETLFRIINDLSAKGISVLYISHRMAEIYRICSAITILRDGMYINTVKTNEVLPDKVIQMMVGRSINCFYPEKSKSVGEEILSVNNLKRDGVFKDISFKARKGEIVGFYGLVGAGRTEVARAICGIDEMDGGTILLNGAIIDNKNYNKAISNGFAYLTEDRKSQGLFLQMSVQHNITAAKLDQVTKGINVDTEKEKQISEEFIGKLNIKISSILQKVIDLSGGNQQKVMIAKWLVTKPKVFILDEPTRGIDVASKSEIHNMLRKLSNEGICIIMISSELPEVIGICDRVIVMHEGHITEELISDGISEENIIKYASGHR